MPRESSRYCKYEKDRRNRLNESFKKLEEVLPCYNYSVNLSKPAILDKAVVYINELKEKVKNFLTADPENKPEHEEIIQLYKRVKQLLTRNAQLSKLLKDAGITIPSDCGSTKLFKDEFKMWSQVISPEKAAMMAELEEQKENEPRKLKRKCIQKKKVAPKKQFLKQKQKSTKKGRGNAGQKNATQIVIAGTNFNPVQNLVTVANVQPCFFITNNISNTLAMTGITNPATTVLSNSNMPTTPILSTAAKTPIVFSKPTTLPAGSFIFANDLPVIQPPTLINPPIILNAPPTNTVILVDKPNQNSNPLPLKKPGTTTPPKSAGNSSKPSETSCVKFNNTKTTHVNKVPIPASQFASDYFVISKVPSGKSVNVKKCQKAAKRVRRKRRNVEKVVSMLKKAKNDGVIEKVEGAENETKKVGSSDYSIDAICKDKPEEISASVETEKVVDTINTSVEKAPEVVDKVDKKIEEPVKTVEPEKEKPEKPLETIPDTLHSELSNDIFASLQVPTGGQNPESTSPTAAFLNAFPLVSSFTGVKVTEVMEEETSGSHHGTPTLLQIGTMDSTKPTQSLTDTLTPSLLNLENFSFFSSKELYNAFDAVVTSTNACSKITTSKEINVITKTAKILYDTAVSETVCVKPNQVVAKLTTTPLTTTTPATVIQNNSIPVIMNNNNSISSVPQKLVTTVTAQTTSTISYSIPNTYAQPLYNHNNTQVVSSVSQISANINYVEHKTKPDKSACSRYTSYNISEYNTFNPFTDLPKTSAVCAYTATKTYTQPTYTNNSNCNYNYQTDFNTNYPVKNIGKAEKYYNMNYENYDNTNQYNYYNTQLKGNAGKVKSNDAAPRPPVNWMTAPDLKQQAADFVVPTFGKDDFVANIYTQNNFVSNAPTTYFNATAPTYSSTEIHNSFEGKKLESQFNNGCQRNDVEEHQFSWSPTKLPQLLDPSHGFVATTLPTLVGDLALGNTQYQDKNKMKKDRRMAQQNFDATTNFLSVSQLVDHNKTESGARISSRRNSGGRSKATTPKSKRSNKTENKETVMSPSYKPVEKITFNNQNNQSGEWMGEAKRNKQPPSSYSAEALIGHPPQPQNQNKQRTQQNYSKTLPVPTFFSENMLYFPPVDIQQDNNFSQQNQNYQNNTFTHSFPPSNTYSSAATYLPSTNFIPEITDYNPIIPDNIFSHSNTTKIPENKQFNKAQNKPPANKPIFNNTTPKKSKKKTNAETSAPGFVDFSFLSMPGAINSPILPDDFHAHSNFLTPPNHNQLYPCKNPLYPKQGAELSGGLLPLPPVSRSNIQHAEISPSLNTVGTSLTNFNLSTIFPEINKSTVPDMYLDPTKNKDYGLQRSYLPTTSQIPPFSKTPIYSTITTQSFPNS